MVTYKNNNIHRLIYYYLFLMFTFMLPVLAKALPAIIILIILNWIVEGRFRWKLRQCMHNRQSLMILSFALLFVIYAISLLYSKDLRQGFTELGVKLSLLIFPVIIATIDRSIFSAKKTAYILLAFVGGCFLSSLIMLSGAAMRFTISSNLYEFIYIKLAAGGHPSYLSMYFSLTIAIIATYMTSRWEYSSSKVRTILVFLLVYCSFMILLLSSKAGVVAQIMVFFALSIHSLHRRVHFVQSIILSGLAVLFIISAFYLFPPTMGRFGAAFKTLNNYEQLKPESKESTAERILIWDSAIEVGMDNILIGYGIGDVKKTLESIYEKNQVIQAHRLSLNAHNEYLQTFVATGLAGLIILSLTLLLPLILSFRRRDILYISFLLIIGSNFLFEAMLSRQAGVVFYAFFIVFFFISLEKVIFPSDPFPDQTDIKSAAKNN